MPTSCSRRSDMDSSSAAIFGHPLQQRTLTSLEHRPNTAEHCQVKSGPQHLAMLRTCLIHYQTWRLTQVLRKSLAMASTHLYNPVLLSQAQGFAIDTMVQCGYADDDEAACKLDVAGDVHHGRIWRPTMILSLDLIRMEYCWSEDCLVASARVCESLKWEPAEHTIECGLSNGSFSMPPLQPRHWCTSILQHHFSSLISCHWCCAMMCLSHEEERPDTTWTNICHHNGTNLLMDHRWSITILSIIHDRKASQSCPGNI